MSDEPIIGNNGGDGKAPAPTPPGRVFSLGSARPALGGPTPTNLSRVQLTRKAVALEQQLAGLARHVQQVAGIARQAVVDAHHAMAFEGALLRTLVRKGIITEEDVRETVRLEAEAKKAKAEAPAAASPAPEVTEAPAAPEAAITPTAEKQAG
jgi:hypothetical protein